MGKGLTLKLWNSFLKMLSDPKTLCCHHNYYSSLSTWIINNKSSFDADEFNRYGLDILIQLDPYDYVAENSDINLINEYNRWCRHEHMKMNVFIMLLRDTLWNLVAIRSKNDCPRCQEELKYVVAYTEEEKQIILECDRCGLILDLNGSICHSKIKYVVPAKKIDLEFLY